MALQPIDYSSAGLQALQGGLQVGLGLREANMRQQLFDQQQEQQKKQQEFGVALKSAWESGDQKSMVDLIASNPEQLQTIQGLMGFRDQQQRQAIGNVASQLTAALDSGNMQGAAGVIQSNAEVLKAMGQDPATLLQQLQQDPVTLRRGADSLMLLTMSPDQVMEYKQKLEDQQLKRDQMAVQMRGQDITARGQDISASNAALDRQIRMLESQQRQLDREAARETNDLKRQELQQKLASNQQAIEQAKVEKNDALKSSYNSTTEALDLVKDLRSSKGLSSAVGWQSAAPTIPGSQSADFETKFEQLQGMLTLENMGIMKGVLSDSDIKMIKAASAGLNLGMSEKEFKNRLGVIERKLESKLSSTTEKNPDLFNVTKTMSDEDLINKYLR
ncbi:MAG: phage DNA ejection protein [Plesiomonas sp.]